MISRIPQGVSAWVIDLSLVMMALPPRDPYDDDDDNEDDEEDDEGEEEEEPAVIREPDE